MKKIYSTIMMLATLVSALSLIACGNDDEENGNIKGGGSSSLVGTWDIVGNVYYMEGEEPEYENGNGAYWVFTANKLTVHDSSDLMNGVAVDYTYSGNKLTLGGFSLYTVTELTSSKLVIKSEATYGGYDIITFKKR